MLIVKKLLDEIKRKQYFTVVLELERPMKIIGEVPFNCTIKDNIVTFTILALDEEIAYLTAIDYLNSIEDGYEG
jgi:hypothetical protein